MTTADDKITALPTLLERLGLRIDQAWQRTCKGEAEWVEGSLELAQALAEGRARFPSDVAFGKWLEANGHKHFSHQGRAALIGLASDITLARELLSETKSRSYELIWRQVQDRFTSARKPDKPKRGRPRKVAMATKVSVVGEAIRPLIEAGETVPQKEWAKRLAVGTNTVQRAVLQERARIEGASELFDTAAPENFSEKGKLRIEDAIRIHQKRLDKQFERVVNAEVRRRIDAANDAMRTNYARLSADNLNLTKIVGQRGMFTETQYRQMLMLCHPDSSAGPELKAELLQILIENKIRLIKPEK